MSAPRFHTEMFCNYFLQIDFRVTTRPADDLSLYLRGKEKAVYRICSIVRGKEKKVSITIGEN